MAVHVLCLMRFDGGKLCCVVMCVCSLVSDEFAATNCE